MVEVTHNGQEEGRTDEDLILAWRGGHDAALESLLRRYEVRIYSFLFRMLRNQHDAEDAAQECFIRAVRALDRFSADRGKFKSWLFQIACREGLRVAERRRRLPAGADAWAEHGRPAPEALDQGPRPGDAVVSNEYSERIRQAVETLPDAERQVVLLRIYSELRFREIAEVMGTPLNTVLGRMHNASLRLRELLGEQRSDT